MTRDCAIFLTHRWTPQIARHYARLQQEAADVVDVFLAFQPARDSSAPAEADFVVRPAEAAERFAVRHAEFIAGKRRGTTGYTDLIWANLFLSPELERYQRFWLVEYDVDYSGNWRDFFSAVSPYGEDLLVTRLRKLSHDPHWRQQYDYAQPSGLLADPLIGFFPISRLSRALAERYPQIVANAEWRGHFEMVLPNAAASAGFSVGDIGGTGPMVAPDRRGLHYSAGYSEEDRSGSFGFQPPRGTNYCFGRQRLLWKPDRLYHPIKADLDLRARMKAREQRFRYWWRGLLAGPVR